MKWEMAFKATMDFNLGLEMLSIWHSAAWRMGCVEDTPIWWGVGQAAVQKRLVVLATLGYGNYMIKNLVA